MGPRFENRGKMGITGPIDVRLEASMGPRFENRGKTTLSASNIQSWVASMGPRFENRGKERYPDWFDQLTAELQWGHGSKTVERCNYCAVWAYNFHASMGPRFENRGKSQTHRGPLPGPWASMGPRFENRGK